MHEPLFRPEVYTAPPSAWGATRLRPPLPWQCVVAVCVSVVAAFILLLVKGQYVNKAKVVGYLAPAQGIVTLWSPSGGVITQLYVREGDSVAAGQALCVITNEGATAAGNTQVKILEQLKTKKTSLEESLAQQDTIVNLEQAKLNAQREKLKSDWLQNRAEYNLSESKIHSLQLLGEKYQHLYRQQFVSELELEQARQRLLEAQLQIQSLTQTGNYLHNEIARMAQEYKLSAVHSEERKKALLRDISQLQQEIVQQEQNSARQIVAPTAGIIGNVPAHVHQMVNANERLITLLPLHSPLQATVLVPSRAAGFIALGQDVVLRYSAFPYQKFGTQQGKIIAIDQAATLPSDSNLVLPIKEPSYLVSVQLAQQFIHTYQEPTPLKPGMLLDADIYLDRRSLAEWLLDPIRSISRKNG
jgi:membrane fusion protein